MKLNRPPTPEEDLACCMEEMVLKSSTEQQTTSKGSLKSQSSEFESPVQSPADIFQIDRKAREKVSDKKRIKQEKQTISNQNKVFQEHAQEMNIFEGAIEKGKDILKKVHNSGIYKQIRHRKIKSAAALFVACKMTQIKKDIKEIALVTGTTQKDISRC